MTCLVIGSTGLLRLILVFSTNVSYSVFSYFLHTQKVYNFGPVQEGRTARGGSVCGSGLAVNGEKPEKEKKKKSISTLKSVSAVTKAWGSRLSPKLERRKVKSKVALMKVSFIIAFKLGLLTTSKFLYLITSKVERGQH